MVTLLILININFIDLISVAIFDDKKLITVGKVFGYVLNLSQQIQFRVLVNDLISFS